MRASCCDAVRCPFSTSLAAATELCRATTSMKSYDLSRRCAYARSSAVTLRFTRILRLAPQPSPLSFATALRTPTGKSKTHHEFPALVSSHCLLPPGTPFFSDLSRRAVEPDGCRIYSSLHDFFLSRLLSRKLQGQNC